MTEEELKELREYKFKYKVLIEALVEANSKVNFIGRKTRTHYLAKIFTALKEAKHNFEDGVVENANKLSPEQRRTLANLVGIIEAEIWNHPKYKSFLDSSLPVRGAPRR